jgi:hypothetical protein
MGELILLDPQKAVPTCSRLNCSQFVDACKPYKADTLFQQPPIVVRTWKSGYAALSDDHAIAAALYYNRRPVAFVATSPEDTLRSGDYQLANGLRLSITPSMSARVRLAVRDDYFTVEGAAEQSVALERTYQSLFEDAFGALPHSR